MITDSLVILAGAIAGATVTGQSLAGSTNATVNGTNVIDTGGVGTQGGNPGAFAASGDLSTVVTVTQAFIGATSAAFQLVQADDLTLSVNAEVLVSTGPMSMAQLSAGTQIPLQTRSDVPSGIKRRYMGLQTVIVGGPLTAGAITASASPGVSDAAANLSNTLYKNGFQVL